MGLSPVNHCEYIISDAFDASDASLATSRSISTIPTSTSANASPYSMMKTYEYSFPLTANPDASSVTLTISSRHCSHRG